MEAVYDLEGMVVSEALNRKTAELVGYVVDKVWEHLRRRLFVDTVEVVIVWQQDNDVCFRHDRVLAVDLEVLCFFDGVRCLGVHFAVIRNLFGPSFLNADDRNRKFLSWLYDSCAAIQNNISWVTFDGTHFMNAIKSGDMEVLRIESRVVGRCHDERCFGFLNYC